MILTALLISSSIAVVLIIFYDKFNKDAVDTSTRESLAMLDARISDLESATKAHTENIRVLSSRITSLEMDIIELRNKVSEMNREINNGATSINNITQFVDKTRSIAEDNTRRLNDIQQKD